MAEHQTDHPSTDTTAQPLFSLFSDFDIGLFKAGKHYHLYNKLGSHQVEHLGQKGTYFAVWAPNARYVSVIGNFNGWDKGKTPMNVRWDSSGIWEVFVPEVGSGEYYKYFIEAHNGYQVEKGDPYAFHWETPPATSTVTWDISGYEWGDKEWLGQRSAATALDKPLSIYEVHLGSWRRNHDDGGKFLTYREMADQLPEYCKYMGFTHVEFMPVMEHPFYGSWGYQLTGYYAPTSRFGTPQDFMYLIDQLHQAGIGVILDWVPSHFPEDQHGLGYFDGTHLYEYADPRKGYHPDWKSLIFNYCRNEVRAFLISNALFWLDKYHIDGLRVDAVASMLYLDYSRKDDEWIPNEHGGRENLEAISFLKEFNDAVHDHHSDVITIAEESTAWPGVTHPITTGGLGFDLKWMMGWMHDTLDYFHTPPVYRSYHQGQITFSLVYAFTEKFVLPLSHDEVVYGKGALLDKMPGDHWQQFANLRLLYGYMFGHPGAKLIFMGGEFGQRHEWQHDFSLDWHENHNPLNNGVQKLLADLNRLYTSEPALYDYNYSWEGFEWIDISDVTNSVISWIRKGKREEDKLIFVANMTPVPRANYRIGVPKRGYYTEVLNTDNLKYGGSDVLNAGELDAYPVPIHGKTHSLSLTLPPLGIIVLRYNKPGDWWWDDVKTNIKKI
ncbi:1,4-alpha-glucan branching protein GlgB [Mucilaginibacter sp. RS28]|uniref:1,4-alpha-glucan branching enzyme GlgB n=1 Tax=Mucilaginibacter straminoryzae TaxID=2932774 RepID=A0A9X2BA99_9SPHI|nr:1,4-alpha-glucan branching protein GlgB [Mucilaginibacter straminoryzae]MCJ8210570.1 1,4-alpha-glucan branching protein GlgB [Mucilaginibacter straminoryzae]